MVIFMLIYFKCCDCFLELPHGLSYKESSCKAGDSGDTVWVESLGGEDPLELGMTTHSSILTWKLPWTENPGGHSPWGHKELDITEPIMDGLFP